MKKLVLASAMLAAMFSMPAHASDEKMMFPIAGGMSDSDAQAKLDPSIKFFFGDQPAPKGTKLGFDKTSQKTNAFAKSADKVCNRAFLSGLLSLQKRAQELGANAVVNIKSNYNNIEYSSQTDFECHVGGIMGGVALKADFVKIGN
ncbi:MAG: excinuclease ATPase subunit [Burkholderiaceae bacterium]|nr:excinuclease ATPase subunit [Burkholderiaceae bacterium]